MQRHSKGRSMALVSKDALDRLFSELKSKYVLRSKMMFYLILSYLIGMTKFD